MVKRSIVSIYSSDKMERDFCADFPVFPRKDSLSCVSMTSGNVSHPPHPQACGTASVPQIPTLGSHPGRERWLHGPPFLLSWSQVLLRKSFHIPFLPLPHQKLHVLHIQLLLSKQIQRRKLERTRGSQPIQPDPFNLNFGHRTTSIGLFELCAFWYIYLYFRFFWIWET